MAFSQAKTLGIYTSKWSRSFTCWRPWGGTHGSSVRQSARCLSKMEAVCLVQKLCYRLDCSSTLPKRLHYMCACVLLAFMAYGGQSSRADQRYQHGLHTFCSDCPEIQQRDGHMTYKYKQIKTDAVASNRGATRSVDRWFLGEHVFEMSSDGLDTWQVHRDNYGAHFEHIYDLVGGWGEATEVIMTYWPRLLAGQVFQMSPDRLETWQVHRVNYGAHAGIPHALVWCQGDA